MEEAGCQEANEHENFFFFCLLQSFIASPQGGSCLSLSLLTSFAVTGHLLPSMESVLAPFRLHWGGPG